MTTSEIILLSITVLLCVCLISILILFLRKKSGTDYNLDKQFEAQRNLIKMMSESSSANTKDYSEMVVKMVGENLLSQNTRLSDIQNRIDSLLKNNDEKLTKASEQIQLGLEKLQQENSKKLEEMRTTVDEKLNKTLGTRLNESFALINERLEAVYKGLGEMQALSLDARDLKKILSNVKSRGVCGEIFLGNLLEQILTTEQFDKNVQVKKNSSERVDFAVKLPGKDGAFVYLPIDVKFPIEDYSRLVAASEKGSQEDVEISLKQLEKRVKEEAKSISEKYINVPQTTDFAILYLATEGLYSEVIKRDGLVENLQSKFKVIVCGPTTISALLNSLQIGFKTLAIEKRSSEIWGLLGEFKKEFETFASLLSKTQKKLSEATDTIDSASKRTQIIAKRLRTVAVIDSEKTDKLDEIVNGDIGDNQ